MQELEKIPYNNRVGKDSSATPSCPIPKASPCTRNVPSAMNLMQKFSCCLTYIVDLTPCISPEPRDAPALEKNAPSQNEDHEVTGVRKLLGKTLTVYCA